MPRAISSGSTRQANRLSVLALKQAEPKLGPTDIGRRLDLPESTVRNILRRWNQTDLENGTCPDKGTIGRPRKRSCRWSRCDCPKITCISQNLVIFRHLAKISQRNPGYSLLRLAREMYHWELRHLEARPKGAVYPVPVMASKESVRTELKRMGIKCHRCAN